MKDDRVYLAHIMEAIEKVEKYASSKTYEDLLSDSLLQDGVVRQLQVIGEACKLLSGDIKADNPQVPWGDIAGMRDMLVHQYFRIDLKKVWGTLKNDVPELKKAVEKILEPAGGFAALKEKAASYAAKRKPGSEGPKAAKRIRKKN